jgi:hypothetical protein
MTARRSPTDDRPMLRRWDQAVCHAVAALLVVNAVAEDLHAGLPWVVDLRVATRPLYALHFRVIDLEAAIEQRFPRCSRTSRKNRCWSCKDSVTSFEGRPTSPRFLRTFPRLHPSRDDRRGRRRELGQARRRLRERPRYRNESRNGRRQQLSSGTSFWRPRRRRIKTALARGEAERGAVTMDSHVEYPHAWVGRR